MESPTKMKKCTVKLMRLPFMGATPAEIQDQIVDRRIRRCIVRVHRYTDAKKRLELVHSTSSANGSEFKTRRFCVRVIRLNVPHSDIASSAASVVSRCSLLSDIKDFTQD